MSESETNPATPCIRVLIVESTPAIAALYARRLAMGGLVSDESLPPALIVCGEPMSGVEQAQRVAELAAAHPDTPILALAAPQVADTNALFDAGAAAVLQRCPGYLDQLALTALGLVRQSRGTTLGRALEEIRTENRTLHELIERLESVAATDPLTGLANRRAIDGQLEALFNAAKRYGIELSCLMIDLDYLKLVNDRLGHAAGDELLRAAADSIRQACRKSDVPGRIGGDEFVVLMPHTPAAAAKHLEKRIRERFRINTRSIAAKLGTHGRLIGLSIGVSSTAMPAAAGPAEMLTTADEAMYTDKQQRQGPVGIGEGLRRSA